MIVTNEKLKKAFVTSIFLVVALVLPSSTWATAGSPQNCTSGQSCIVGEFLYDDEYAPVTTGTCNITSRYPDGSLYIDDVSMTVAAENDGWYSHSFTAPTTLGSYRTDVCCTVNSELICIDKTFDVSQDESSDEIAGAVWGYSNRSLSSFGSLVSDIWGYSSRSLTSLGTLVRDIWIHEDRTLTDADLDEGKLVTQTSEGSDIDLSKIERTVGENRLLLEQLVNKPIIETFLEEEEDIDLSEKLKNTRAIANQMYVNNQYLTTKSASLVSSWNRVGNRDRLDNVISLNNLLGEETDSSSSDTIFGSINWMRKSWDWEDGQDIYTLAKKAKKNMTSSQASLASYGGSNSSYSSMKLAVRNLVELEKLIGNSTDSIQKKSLYGKIRQVEEHVAVLNTREGEVDAILADWREAKDSKNTKREVNDIQRKVIAVNRVPDASTILNVKSDDDESIVKALKNKLLGIKGIINANKKLLAVGAGKSLTSTWLEEGSIVFKTLATNPSKLISQDVEIKYYLPQEVREEDIISVDEGLTISYDSETDKYYAEGKFNLAAGESIAFSVKVDDIWKITEQEVDSLRRQAEELSKPLDNTSFFAQGVTLKSDIDASLDKIITLQENAYTPEQQIRAYREAAIEKQAVEQKLVSMQDLVTQAGATGTLFGFVGGAQTLAVWGLIIIMAIGFVFLALYMRTVTKSPTKDKKKKSSEKPDEKGGQKTSSGSGFDLIKIIKFATPFAIIALVSASLTGVIVAKLVTNSVREEVLGQQTEVQTEESLSGDEVSEEGETALGGLDIVWLDVPDGLSVEIRSERSNDGDIVLETTQSQEVIRVDEIEGWVNVLLDDEETLEFATEGWVSAEYIVVPNLDQDEKDELGSLDIDSTVLIEETSTGWLRVRSNPRGIEIEKVSPGETFELLDEQTDWYEIQIDEDTSGWISKQYSSIE